MPEIYRFRDGQEIRVGSYTLSGLLGERFYPNKREKFYPQVWIMKQHDYGCPGHRLKLLRMEKAVGRWPIPPSCRWDD